MNTEALLREVREQLTDGGLRACLLVRDLRTGEELGIEPDTELPSASLVKVPLALATLERVRRGELDGATVLDVAPGRVTTPGPTGLSRFRHPARIAIDDLLYLSICLSDGTAADALFDLTPPEQVTGILRDAGLRGITVRHRTEELFDTPVERFDPDQVHLATPWPSTRAPAGGATGWRNWTRRAPTPAARARSPTSCRRCGPRRRSIRRWPGVSVTSWRTTSCATGWPPTSAPTRAGGRPRRAPC